VSALLLLSFLLQNPGVEVAGSLFSSFFFRESGGDMREGKIGRHHFPFPFCLCSGYEEEVASFSFLSPFLSDWRLADEEWRIED